MMATEAQESVRSVYIVRVGHGDCWLAAWDGDPGRTLIKESAQRFAKWSQAEAAIRLARRLRNTEYTIETFNLLNEICERLSSARFNYNNEAELQAALAQHLASFQPRAEFRLNERDRIDFVIEGIGIEVKVDGSRAAVLRQLHRYAHSGLLDALILVTTRTRHVMPTELNKIPVVTVSLVLQGAFG